jgi:hypothetical protein
MCFPTVLQECNGGGKTNTCRRIFFRQVRLHMELPRKFILPIAIVASASVVAAMIVKRSDPVQPASQINSAKSSPPEIIERPNVDLGNYKAALTKIENNRQALWSRYQRATTPSEKETAIAEARESFVESVSNEIFPYWYGTNWDFNGTTETPGQGKIACGYFVSTVLRDVGLRVERVRLAQQASENIILSLTTNTHTRRFRQVPIKSFVEAVQKWGDGLYVVGLDVHVGFILNAGGNVYFIHPSYVDPFCVVNERALESRILTDSRYRVLGKLSEDGNLILKWLSGDRLPTRL